MRARRAIRVYGAVQGVGLRPLVFRLASRAALTGFVRNDAGGVHIELEGDEPSLGRFVDELRAAAPPLARIDRVEVSPLAPRGDRELRILASEATGAGAAIPADAATCDACLRELFDPRDRRYRYPFVNCTDCGPRYTIVRDVPYDRAKTTMDAFAICAACLAEYEDPWSRRFHAEPNACPACGPRVALFERGEKVAEKDDAIARAGRILRGGGIVAVKGLGGYQLAAVAGDESAVARLRERKRRPHKPFAIVARDLRDAEVIAIVDEAAAAALASRARPIVLLRRRGEPLAPSVAPGVAMALDEIGVMLPATPLHHLLLEAAAPLLVMTSGNLADEPIAKDDDHARVALAGVADAWLAHDRAIHTRADDSVVRIVDGGPQPVRRARGFVPDAVALFDAPCVLAVGAHQKSTVCVTRGREAFVSQHIGDLDDLDAEAFFDETIAKLTRLLGVAPAAVAHDLHPDYASTRWAMASRLRRIGVQHHHAHVAACLAEHGREGPVVGVAFDGTGCGPAGDLWGGEILVADLDGFRRVGHLRPIALAGGEAAIREPWRLGLAALADAGEPLDPLASVPRDRRDAVLRMIERRVASPRATGAGRWFDAVAAIIGVRDAITYDAQAAIELEALAARAAPGCGAYAFDVRDGDPFEIDLRPAVRAIAADRRRGEPRERIARRFHATLGDALVAACARAGDAHGLTTVALSGGVFQNRLLTEDAASKLRERGFEVLVHRRVPPNDGGLSLGQAAIAARRLASERTTGGGHVPGNSR